AVHVGLFWLNARRIAHEEHVVDIRALQELLERFVGAPVRDAKARAVLEREKRVVVAGDYIRIGGHEPVQILLYGVRHRAIAFPGAGCVAAKHAENRTKDRRSCNEPFSSGHWVSSSNAIHFGPYRRTLRLIT